jgi:hypothetical protein
VGNLCIPGNPMPWEEEVVDPRDKSYATNLALPLDIEIEASNGASDYGIYIYFNFFFYLILLYKVINMESL